MPQPLPIPHDSGYKLLFSHPRMVADLLTGFVDPSWLHLVDLDTLEPYKASFATDNLRLRHDDCIWRVQSATPAQLETWSLNILDAATLDEVFTD